MSRLQTRQRPAATGRRGKANYSRAVNDTSLGAQRQRLLSHLRHDSIDTITARRELNIMHPAMRVKELREAGHNIATIRVDRHDTEGRKHRQVALYVLQVGAA
jgi:hypothetical protein